MLVVQTEHRQRIQICLGCDMALNATQSGMVAKHEGVFDMTVADCNTCELCVVVCCHRHTPSSTAKSSAKLKLSLPLAALFTTF